MPVGWPQEVRAAVEAVVRGSATSALVVERLSGLSGRPVWRVDGPGGSVVVKQEAHPRETGFYRHVAAALDPAIGVPEAYCVVDGWLVLEHLPEPLPRERWLADTSVMRALGALHGSAAALDLVTDPFLPQWPERYTEAAAERVRPEHRLATSRALQRLRRESERWLTGDTLVSGDPNPRNWGLRTDGTVVLVDWERTGRATAAVDVATTVPGLPSRDQLELVAAAYLEGTRRWNGGGWTRDDLARGLAVVKAWTCVELLAQDRDDADLQALQQRLADTLPPWLASIP